MCLGELTLQKVKQLQKLDTFYNGMYRFLQYQHLPKDKLLARNIQQRYVHCGQLTNISFMEQTVKQTHKQFCIPRELRPPILSILNYTKCTSYRGVHDNPKKMVKKFILCDQCE